MDESKRRDKLDDCTAIRNGISRNPLQLGVSPFATSSQTAVFG
jgi:hypothetical protein